MEKNRSTIDIDGVIKDLSKSLPYVFGRSAILKLMPGIIAPGTLANLASQKKGPPCTVARGKVLYERDSFLAWLKGWLSNITTSNVEINKKEICINLRTNLKRKEQTMARPVFIHRSESQKKQMNKKILFRNNINDVWTKGTLIKQNEDSCAEVVVSIGGFTTSLYIPINKTIPFENNESLEGTKRHISFNDKDLIIVSKGINHRWEIRLFKEYKNKYYYVYTDVDKSEDKFKYGVPYSSETAYLLTTITETQTLENLGL